MDREEILPVLLMGAYGFLAMTSYYLIKPARNSIFVDRVGADNLPYIYILTALLVTAVVLVYSRYVERIGERSLLLGTFGLLSGSLVFFWWLLTRDASFWSSGAFYIWGKLYPLLLVSQFWLVGNLVFTTRQARRVFGVVGIGLILGGIAGSALAGAFASVIGTEPLLLVAAGVLLLCAALCSALFPRMGSARGGSARLLEEFSGDAVRILMRSSHLRAIAGILALTILVGTLLDWQLNRAVELSIPTEDGMTRFWGYFYMALNVASVTIQALATGFVLRRWGVGVAILVLPAALLVATVGVLAAPVLLTVALAKGTEGALRYSLDQSTREVLYLPVPVETKYKVKPLIDLAVYRGGTGLGGVILLLAVQGLGFGIREVAVVVGVMIAVWVAVAVRMRKEYVASLSRSMRGRFAHVEPTAVSSFEAGVLRTVREALSDRDPVQCAFVLDLLDRGGAAAVADVADDVVRILDHPEPKIRGRALEVLSRVPDGVPADAVEALLRDPDPGVRESAVGALCSLREAPPERVVQDLLGSGDAGVRIAVLRCLVKGRVPVDGTAPVEGSVPAVTPAGAARVGRAYPKEVRGEISELDERSRLEVALAAGAFPEDPRSLGDLERLLDDPDAEVASAAAWSAVRSGHPEPLSRVVGALGRRETRVAAREALLAAGEEGVRALEAVLLDDAADPDVRRRVPVVLGHAPLQASVDALRRIAESGCRDGIVERRSLHALRRLRVGDGADLRFDAEPIRMAAERQLDGAEAYAAVARNLRAAVGPRIRSDVTPVGEFVVSAGEGLELLLDAVREGWEERREALFDCLSTLHPSEEMRQAYRAVVSGDGALRSNAVEWLEHTVPGDLFEAIAPVLEGDEALRRAPHHPRPDLDALLYGLWHDASSTVASLAVWSSVRIASSGVERRLRIFGEDAPDAGIRSLATALLERRERGQALDARALDPVERAVLLQGAELLRGAGPGHLLVLARAAGERRVEEGEELVRSGEPADGLHVVVRGRVELDPCGSDRTTAGEGGAFGSWSLLDDGPTPIGARALEPTRLLRLRREDFEELLFEDGELARALLRGMGSRLSEKVRA